MVVGYYFVKDFRFDRISELYNCNFVGGDGGGKKADEIQMEGVRGDKCVQTCIEEKKNDPLINGVTIYKKRDVGCWCERNMSVVTGAGVVYKTCFLRPQGIVLSMGL